MKTIIGTAVLLAALCVVAVLGAVVSFSLYLWDKMIDAREERRRRRERLRGVLR